MNAFFRYVQDSFEELRERVTWPTWPELYQTSIIVIIASIVLALMIAGIDRVWAFLLSFIY
jgi:preprotein translocase subunit SecE